MEWNEKRGLKSRLLRNRKRILQGKVELVFRNLYFELSRNSFVLCAAMYLKCACVPVYLYSGGLVSF